MHNVLPYLDPYMGKKVKGPFSGQKLNLCTVLSIDIIKYLNALGILALGDGLCIDIYDKSGLLC